MLQLHDGIALYHGSFTAVAQPDLSKCSPRKDFGRGFYLTSSIDQARNFARIVTRRTARRNGDGQGNAPTCGYVSRYAFSACALLDIRSFPTADAEWLHCIVAHRRGEPFLDIAQDLAYADIVIGKVANDQTNATILAYLAGAYGQMGTESADEICVRLLLPERLQDQACFRTEKALASLSFLGSEEVCL